LSTKEITPQDKAINQSIPLYFYAIHEVNDEIYGHLVNWKPAWEAEKEYVAVYHFNGKAAHYWVATNDMSILRKDALLFAVRVHENKCRIINLDLSQVSNPRKQER